MSELNRRDFLKVVVPGAWVLELRKGQGLGGLSTPAKVGFVKDLVLLTSGTVLGCIAAEKAALTLWKESWSWMRPAKEMCRIYLCPS